MNLYDTYTMKNGSVLAIVNGYSGEEDFNLMQKIIIEEINPDDIGYSVDSMCIGGYFEKDGLSVRTSSESPYDYCSFFFKAQNMKPEEIDKVYEWIDKVVKTLHNKKSPII